MKVISVNLKKDYSAVINEAIGVLKKGGTVIYPTDTLYGLGCDACNKTAVECVYKIKHKPFDFALPVIAKNILWVRELAFVPPKLEPKLAKVWPGAVTVILPKKQVIPSIVTGGRRNVGVRIPNYEFTDRLLGKFGFPLVSTSANIFGVEGSGDIREIIIQFEKEIWKPDLVIDAGRLPPSQPSTVIDFSVIKPKILRRGAVNPEKIIEILESNDKRPH